MFCLVAVRDGELFEFLTIHGPQPHRALLRGAPASGVDFSQPHAVYNKQPDGATPTLERGAPVGWAAFDLDGSLPVPGIDWRTHPREAAGAIAERDLPPWATEADYVAYYSGLQGFADVMKLRAFVLLERPITSADLKRLMTAGTSPVDLALYSDAQLHHGDAAVHRQRRRPTARRSALFLQTRAPACGTPLPANSRVTHLPQSAERTVLPPPAGRTVESRSRNPGAPRSPSSVSSPAWASRPTAKKASINQYPGAVDPVQRMRPGRRSDFDHRPLAACGRTRGQRDAAYIERETCGLFHFAENLSLRERSQRAKRTMARGAVDQDLRR
jgi:hypothetical protein